MTTPHSSWAKFYDAAYEQSFGEFYNQLTDVTVELIEDCVKPPARIIDFGAGTGRLSIPLATRGYDVVAVDSCTQMLEQLSGKHGGERITTVVGRMQDFHSDDQFEMAICVFTVLLYLLDEESLEKSVEAAVNALRSGGLLLIDIPSRWVFQSYQRHTPKMKRSVSVVSQGGDLYRYEEATTVYSDGSACSYSDQFLIKYWEVEKVLNVLTRHGLSMERDLTEAFSGSGSLYFLMKKIDGTERTAPYGQPFRYGVKDHGPA
jgi:SAM-dependent methyltransferase